MLRCISMIMIVMTHLISHGAILKTLELGSLRYIGVSIPECIVACAVDVFALITGYVMVTVEYRRSKIIGHWCQIFFYSIVLTIIVWLYHPDAISVKGLAKTVMPVMFGQYWYFTAYFALFFCIPFLNVLLQEKSSRTLLLTILAVFSVLPTLVMQDTFITGYGYSPLWLGICYLFGGYIRLHIENRKIPTASKCLLCFGVCVIALWGSKVILQFAALRIGISTSLGYYLIGYTSPVVLLSGVFLLIAFAKIQIKSKFVIKIIQWFSPGAFGVYLLHEHFFIRQEFVTDKWIFLNQYPVVLEVLFLVLISVVVFVIGASIDRARGKLFQLLHIEKLEIWIPSLAQKLIRRKVHH